MNVNSGSMNHTTFKKIYLSTDNTPIHVVTVMTSRGHTRPTASSSDALYIHPVMKELTSATQYCNYCHILQDRIYL